MQVNSDCGTLEAFFEPNAVTHPLPDVEPSVGSSDLARGGAHDDSLPIQVDGLIGAHISNLKGLQGARRRASGLGAAGFLATRRDARDWSEILLVSNRHVLLAHGAKAGDPIYLPSFRRAGDSLLFDPAPPALAVISSEGMEGHYRFAYPGESQRPYFVDCASARLLPGQLEGMRRLGRLRAPVRAQSLDALPGREVLVFKLGRGSTCPGRLVATAATVIAPDGRERHNNLAIRSELSRATPNRPFADQGDSGALIVDANCRPLGLLWGTSRADPHLAFACHIHPVLDCLGIVAARFDYLPDGSPGKPAPRPT